MKRWKRFLGEKWTIYGHRPWCQCDGCWTWKGTHHNHQTYPYEVWRAWWEIPFGVSLVLVMIAWGIVCFMCVK